MTPASSVRVATPTVSVRPDGAHPPRDAFVDSHPGASAYHEPAWLELIGRVFGHPTRYLVAESCTRVVGVLPLVLFSSRLFGRFGVSLPFVNYGGVVADSQAAADALLRCAMEEVENARGTHLELRHDRQVFPGLEARHHKVAMRLELAPTADEQWRRLDKKVRNQVRKAEKSGLRSTAGGRELLGQFYAVFARNMRDLGTPVYPARFFDAVVDAFPDRTRVFIVRRGETPVAAALVYWRGRAIEVPWASAVRDFNPLCPNMMLYWEMLRFAIERGFPAFDFGRSTPGEGTFAFKQQWGAEPHPLVWEYGFVGDATMPDLSPTNPRFSLAINAWQRLPVPVATALGPHIVRNIP
jgi:FemAB-related protein (PEP-CTERM system-associated)